jgi:hypothetical protein
MDYEKLGLFYLGRHVDPATRQTTAVPLLYDANDLLTHAAIIGMTGSGKTGLGIALLEEAAIDGIPALVIDPKGDLGNLLLTFPSLSPEEFEPWIDHSRGDQVDAATESARWRDGLREWGQSTDRIARLRAAAEFAVYTPGSTAVQPISILKSFAAPDPVVRDDADLFAERVTTTTTSVLALAGIDAEPMRSREHILIATLLQEAWRKGQNLDLAHLIAAVQSPGLTRVGVLELEAFYPAADRFALAMRLNHLLAAPGFSAWLEGAPLDIGALLYSPTGRPRVSVISIAHLQDAERMFFLGLLFNQLVGWVRQQRGTSSLRAVVYCDEVVGLLPPVANPPTKPPLLTLLKQARAHGVGMVLATQNPIDLDYKALSNTGTWFLGRLQTERDKARVLDGLEGASTASGGSFDRASIDRMLSGLEKRVFLLHNVHESAPVLFQTRWTMSYLRGPMSRTELARLVAPIAPSAPAPSAPAPAAPFAPSPPAPAQPLAPSAPSVLAPILDPAIPQLFAPGQGTRWSPALLGAARVSYRDAKLGVDDTRDVVVTTPIMTGPVPVDWERAELAPWKLEDLRETSDRSLPFDPAPAAATQPKRFAQFSKDFGAWIAQSQAIELFHSSRTNLTSHADESEAAFRIRVRESLREERDAAVAKARAKFAPKLATAEDRVRRAEHAVQREQQQSTESKMQTGVSIAAAIAGALLGRRIVSAGSVGRATTAARGMGRIGREAQDVARAEENVQSARERRDEVAAELQRELEAVASEWDRADETMERILVKPKRGGVAVQTVALVWRAV